MMTGGQKLAAALAAATTMMCGSGIALGDIIQIGAARDNTLYEDFQGSLSNGVGEFMFAGATAGFSYRRALVAFNVADYVPSGSTILSASLTLHMSMTIASDRIVSLHAVQQNWGEGASHAPGQEGSGAPAEPGDATWKHTFYDTQFWTNLGGDFNPVASGSAVIGDLFGYYTWDSTAAMVADVQNWLDNPASSFGWELIGDESEPFTAKRFDTKDNRNETFRPMLTIEYVPVPEPGVAVFLAMGLGCASGRRRRLSAS